MKSIWGKVSEFWHVGVNSHHLFVGNVSYICTSRISLRTIQTSVIAELCERIALLKEWSVSRMATTALGQTDQPWAFSIQLMQAEPHNLFSPNSNWNTVDPSHVCFAHSNISTLNFMSVSFFLQLACLASNKHLHLLFLLSLLIQMLLYKVIIAFHELSHAILAFFSTGSTNLPLVKGKLRLYSMWFCPYAQRAHLVLDAKKIS
jgi:hypothetical protein